MEKLPQVLAPGGRVAILTFHSGEDRIVKKSFKQFYKAGIYSAISEEVIRPSAEECARNSEGAFYEDEMGNPGAGGLTGGLIKCMKAGLFVIPFEKGRMQRTCFLFITVRGLKRYENVIVRLSEIL